MNPFNRKLLRLALGLVAGLTTACVPSRGIVARAGHQALTVEQLARIIFEWRRTAVDTTLMTRVAHWWVDDQLFAQRVMAGDSMLDSSTVLDVMWAQARAFVLARWRGQLFASQLPLGSESLERVYRAGDYRLVQHVLWRAPERGAPEARARARRRADALRKELAGGLPWEVAQRQNQDTVAGQQRGSVGVITRGQTEPEFERAAFALEPGEISAVVGSSYGFHVLRRPPLDEVREAFKAAVEPLVAERLDSLRRRELMRRWRLAVRSDGLDRAAEVVRDPLRYKDSRATIATFEGGRFTLADLVRWLESVPEWLHTSVERGSEERLSQFLELMMGYELLYREALSHDLHVSPEEFAQLKATLARTVDRLKTALNLYPPGPGDSASVRELERRAAENVDRYLTTLPRDWQRFERVPARLADRLRARRNWAVYPRGVRRCLQRLTEMMAAQNSLSPPSVR